MVTMLNEFPGVRVTFNLVPSLLVQNDAFARGRRGTSSAYRSQTRGHAGSGRTGLSRGERVSRARRPSDSPAPSLRGALHASPSAGLVHRTGCARPAGDPQARVDGSDLLQRDERLRNCWPRGRTTPRRTRRGFTPWSWSCSGQWSHPAVAAAATGRVELSTSPFYHPILPLLCDSDVHFRAHPGSELPQQLFTHPDDARAQLARAFDFRLAVWVPARAGVAVGRRRVGRGRAPDRGAGCAWTASDEASWRVPSSAR